MRKDTHFTEEKVELKGRLSEFRDALEDEIAYIKSSGQSSTLLFAGRQIKSNNTEFWYHFRVEYAPTLPADTPCKLIIGREQFDVTVISFEENAIILASKNPLPEAIGNARLENGATVLMERLIKCIEDNAAKKNFAGEKMFPTDDGKVYTAKKIFSYDNLSRNNSNTIRQNEAIEAALTNDITYIWGPPGTGKTTVIGQIIEELYKHSRSVLVVSHTNTAVDGAIEKAVESYSKCENPAAPYPILRLGSPTKRLSEKVLLESHIAELGKELYAKKKELEEAQASIQHRLNEIRLTIRKAAWIKESKLPVIGELFQEVSDLEEQERSIQKQIEELLSIIESARQEHPEYRDYSELSGLCDSKKNEQMQLSEELEAMRKTVREVPTLLQDAHDEIKKHDQYLHLKQEESKMMSERFLRSEIAKASNSADSILEEIKKTTEEQTSAQQTVWNYEKKSGFGKFLSGKDTLLQAQQKLKDTGARLTELNEELRKQKRLELDYSVQLEDLLILQEKLRAVIPTYDKQHWEALVQKYENKLTSARESIPALSQQLRVLSDELAINKAAYDKAKEAFSKLAELEESQKQLEKDKRQVIYKTYSKRERISELLERESINSASFYERKGGTDADVYSDLTALFSDIETEIQAVSISACLEEEKKRKEELTGIFAELDELKQQMQELEKKAIFNAQIVGTTLAKSYLSETLRERQFDTVILDEASMASIPALWCAAYLAQNSLVIVGDFLQLPPIVMAQTDLAKKWLGTDVFAHSGIQEMAGRGKAHPNSLVMLNDQFRMESDIAEIANIYYGPYGGLKSNDNTDYRNNDRKEFYEWFPGKNQAEAARRDNITLIDTESLHAWVTGVPRGKSHSRLNMISASVDVDLAFKLIEKKLEKVDSENAKIEKEPSVLIVAPYKPHISKIEKLIDLEYKNRGFKQNLNHIRAGTIHSFQGSEADVVIFDLVIDEPHYKAGLFSSDSKMNSDYRNMFNVAITRARFKLFVVGNFAYCQRRAHNNALSELLDKLIKENGLKKVDAKELLPDLRFDKHSAYTNVQASIGNHIICRDDQFNDLFMQDVRSFKKRLIIYSAFMTENRLSVLLPAFIDAINGGKQIIVVTKSLAERGKRERPQYQKIETELTKIGVQVIHKKGMHEKLIFVDSKAYWNGSLNALSFTGNTTEVMERYEGDDLTSEYEKIYNIEHICAASESGFELKCPVCGGEMLARESDSGGIYWKCENEDYSRNADQPYPVDGVMRCECGAPYIFSMKNEPRWVCSANSKHYRKMRAGDLRLEKMAALIPTKSERKEVDRYFAQKQANKEAEKKPKEKRKEAKSSPVGKQKASGSQQGKLILQLTDDGTVIREFSSINAASAAVGVNTKSIREAAKGIQKHAGGYCWRFKEESPEQLTIPGME